MRDSHVVASVVICTCDPEGAGARLSRMKKDQKKTKRRQKLILAKESVRKLANPALSNVVGGAHTDACPTVTFPKCCLTI